MQEVVRDHSHVPNGNATKYKFVSVGLYKNSLNQLTSAKKWLYLLLYVYLLDNELPEIGK